MTITLESVEIDPELLKTRKADSSGRISLGPEYAGEQVTVLVEDVSND